jgi:Iron-containing redox enzyme
MSAPVAQSAVTQMEGYGQALLDRCRQHACASHDLFDYLRSCRISSGQAAALLKNYDAHATVLRRMLLKAASIMPEEAAGFVLENVRNEYGNGNPAWRHQLQLKDLALRAGAGVQQFHTAAIQPGVRAYIRSIVPHYFPLRSAVPAGLYRPAVAAGAITATEVMALEEFRAMQHAFRHLGLSDHIWFDHINVEAEHSQESLALALHFIERCQAKAAVEFGMHAVLDANLHLYDGLLAALQSA